MKDILFILFLFFPLLSFSENHFETKKIKIGSQILTVEIADTDEKTSRGLMFRNSLKPGHGMLFIFKTEEVRSFWMKNTFLDLSIGFFNKEKELIDIQDMKAAHSEMQNSFPQYTSSGPAQYALEVPKGWFQTHKIKIGNKFKIL